MVRAAVILALALLAAFPARAFDTLAGAAWVYDMETGTVLLAKNADEALPPASMSKLMTLNMLFEALKDGRVRLDDTFAVSSKARAMGGSNSMFSVISLDIEAGGNASSAFFARSTVPVSMS